jgi:adenosylcobinamide kinase/adenosylcobinamide-phosphate guanylyltransferase
LSSTTFILGGARSGKSRFAVANLSPRARIIYMATAQAGDADMAARIARHQAERPPKWTTREAPIDLVASLREALNAADGVVVDCLTLWVANLMLRGDTDETILKEADALAALAAVPPVEVRIVSNETGLGVHPATADGLRFRDVLGGVNQRMAAAASRVVLMVAGLPHILKEAPSASPFGPRAPEAP